MINVTDSRLKKIRDTLAKRQPTLRVVFENIHDPHNVSAIMRTCDAVGVYQTSLIYNYEKFPKIGKKSSASAFKWVEREKFKVADECFRKLKDQGYTIYASALQPDAISLYDIDFTKKSAVVLGNEHRGVSEEVLKLADKVYYIPMQGMVQSLNVSVAAAVTLYEAMRQRLAAGMYDTLQFSEEEFERLIDLWAVTKKKKVKRT
ncbi:MAG: RNA methyltransferase [Ignavibacteriaceae bacterium]|nr:RNA methyltransferase [Ignavibacteriaceae bacterium]